MKEIPDLTAIEYLRDILNSRVYEVAKETRLFFAELLSHRLNNHIFLKREDEQPIFCYKLRGAHNKMTSLSTEELQKGVIVASAGNHAQGVAMSAYRLGCEATVVMPVTTPAVKVDAVKRWEAKVELVGDSFNEANAYAEKLSKELGKMLIKPFDDPLIIAGQGTVGMEILKQHGGPIHAIFVPIGGGGLISGIATYVKQIRPEVKIIGVEPFESDAMYQSREAGHRVMLEEVGIFADGVAVKQVGMENFRICQQFVDDIVRVNTDEICAAIKDICEDTRTLVEPSGALAVAGVKRWLNDQEHSVSGQNLIAIVSGANVNFDRLRHISERAEIGERREAIFAAEIPEKPGSFRQFCNMLGDRSISEFNYRFAPGDNATIFVGVKIQSFEENEMLIKKLNLEGFPTTDLTDNEMAKVHVRHLVGGRVPNISDERLFSFRFPERQGALQNFLDQVGTTWNITLFHYRNHGSDFGRVLCGLQVPKVSRRDFDQFLQQLGYSYTEETENPVYQLFLR